MPLASCRLVAWKPAYYSPFRYSFVWRTAEKNLTKMGECGVFSRLKPPKHNIAHVRPSFAVCLRVYCLVCWGIMSFWRAFLLILQAFDLLTRTIFASARVLIDFVFITSWNHIYLIRWFFVLKTYTRRLIDRTQSLLCQRQFCQIVHAQAIESRTSCLPSYIKWGREVTEPRWECRHKLLFVFRHSNFYQCTWKEPKIPLVDITLTYSAETNMVSEVYMVK